MLKSLLSDKRILSGIVCFLVFIAGGQAYLQAVKREARRDLHRTQQFIEQWHTQQTERTQIPPAPRREQYPTVGTYPVEPHQPQVPSVSTTPATPQPNVPREADLPALTSSTGQPLREGVSPDTRAPEEHLPRDAKIQKRNAASAALTRSSERLVTQALKLVDGIPRTNDPKQSARLAEQVAVRANMSLSAKEKERLRAALDAEFQELLAGEATKLDTAQSLKAEAIRLLETQRVLLDEIDALQREREALEHR